MKLGEPCWKHDNVEKAISHIAQVDTARMHYFLASHSPIRFITDARLDTVFPEEDFFKSLFVNPPHEQLVFVKGEPGTGKSHLIGWLNLRCKIALESGELKDIVPVIIQRRSGSLKDALDQLVRQLPEEFERYLNPVKNALERITEKTAREALAGKLHLEFGEDTWRMRGRQPLPSYFRNLREVCASQGSREWLCREGGILDQNVKRLIESSNIDERKQLPEFSAEEFFINNPIYSKPGRNIQAVVELIDDFFEYRERREEAAAVFNSVLPAAIREMTGLSGATLKSIFDQIRLDLKGMGKSLALFIEDVSVMSVLDEEVVNAVEPQNRGDLCPITAVLGITEAGAKQLYDNQQERFTRMVSVSRYGEDQWRADVDDVARFTARYLNSVRLNEEEIRKVAYERKTGCDVNISRCDTCTERDACHETFGKVEIEGMPIGMFPFTYTAPQRLLQHLDERRIGVRRNPRGLLMHILRNILLSDESLVLDRFPEDNLPVDLPPLLFWQRFEQRYCSGWEQKEIKRIERLARGWITALSSEEAAAVLHPLLKPLGFRDFSSGIEIESKPTNGKKDLDRKKESEKIQPPEQEETPAALLNLMKDLDAWINQKQDLKFDAAPRQLLADLIRNGINWDDDISIPLAEWKRHVAAGNSPYRFIQIEGMRTKVNPGTFFVNFARSKETHDLIGALAKFRHLGKDSWNFQGGEMEKRLVSLWLRRHTNEVIEKLKPPKELDQLKPVTCATQFLAITAMLRKRAKLPETVVELVEEILSDIWVQPPVAFDTDWIYLIKDMQLRHKNIRDFLLSELDVPQGRGARGINFINPLPIIFAAKELFEYPFSSLDGSYFESFWKARYVNLDRMTRYSDLADIIENEKAELGKEVNKIKNILVSNGYDSEEPRTALAQFCTDLLGVVEAQREARVMEPDGNFDEMVKVKIFSERPNSWGVAIDRSVLVANTEDLEQVLTYDPTNLKEAGFAISHADIYMRKVAQEVDLQLKHIEHEGDPDTLLEEFKKHLTYISVLGEPEVQKEQGGPNE